MYPYNHKRGQTIQSDASGVSVDRAFLAHYNIPAASAPAAGNTAVHAAVNLGAAAQNITTGIANPAVPRNMRVKGSASGITGNVVITGTNFAGETITDTIALSGASAVDGVKAFKTITNIALPVQSHTPAAQTETKQVTHAATSGGTITVTLTAAGYAGAAVALEVEAEDTVAEVAAKIVDALNDQTEFAAMFEASVTGAGSDTVLISALAPAANDPTLSLAFTDTDTTGVTMGSSTDGTTGVAYDTVSVGLGVKFGIPYLLTADELVILKLFNNAADTGTVTPDDDELEKNVIALNGTPDGEKPIDLYILV